MESSMVKCEKARLGAGVELIKITTSDADFIASAKDFGFSDGWSKQMVLNSFNNGGFCGYIAKCNGENVGFITATHVQDFADIESVFINPSYRKSGIAKKLLLELEKELKSKGVESVLLEVRLSNTPAISLYKGCDFKEISTRKKYYADGEDALVLKKELI